MSSWVEPHKYGNGGWAVAGVGTTAGGSATKTGAAGLKRYVTGIECSGDAAALVTIESPSGTPLYRKRFAAAFTLSEGFPTPLECPVGADVLVKVATSTANCEANIQGYSGT